MRKIFLLSLPLLLLSCITYKYQKMSWSHNSETDILKIFHEYEGIHVEGKMISNDELKQFQQIQKRNKTYFFNNWLFEYSTQKVEAAIKENEHSEIIPLLKLLKESITIENGDWYMNSERQLCAWQKVTIKNTTEIINLANKFVRKYYEDKSLKKNLPHLLEEPPNHKYIDIINNQLIYRHPVKFSDYLKAKNEFLTDIQKDVTHPNVRKIMNLLKQAIQVNYNGSFVEIIAGEPGQKVNTLKSLTLMKGNYNDTLRKKVEVDSKLAPHNSPDNPKKSFFN